MPAAEAVMQPALPLSPCTVDVWRMCLDVASDADWAVLATEERQRAWRFRFERDRRRYVAAHGFMRRVLAGYVAAPPGSLTFEANPYGKPALGGEHPVRFNLSHAGDVALLAVAREREVGIDVERMRPGLASEHIPEQFFSRNEVAALRRLPAAAQDRAFFTCWTRKEAYVKAKGQGLSIPLDGFDVSLAPGDPPALLSVREDPAEVARWSIHELAIGQGYLAALVVEGTSVALAWPQASKEYPGGLDCN